MGLEPGLATGVVERVKSRLVAEDVRDVGDDEKVSRRRGIVVGLGQICDRQLRVVVPGVLRDRLALTAGRGVVGRNFEPNRAKHDVGIDVEPSDTK